MPVQLRTTAITLLLMISGALGGFDARSDSHLKSTPKLAELQSGQRALVVGGVADFGRFNFDSRGKTRADGAVQLGMDREIIRILSQRLSIKRVDFVTMNFGELEDALVDGRIDLIANNYWITAERQQKMLFARPYYTRGGIAALWKEGRGFYDHPSKMTGKRIAVLANSHSARWSRENIADAVIVELPGGKEMDDMLRAERVDLSIGSATLFAESALANRDEELYLYSILEPKQAAFALRHDAAELVAIIDGELGKMEQDGTLFGIINKDYKTLVAVSAKSIPD